MPNTRRGKTIGKRIRAIVADNVTKLRDQQFDYLPNRTRRNEALADAAGIAKEQVRRICAQELGASIDHIESLAHALEVAPFELLKANFAARKEAPPVPADPMRAEDEGTLQRKAD